MWPMYFQHQTITIVMTSARTTMSVMATGSGERDLLQSELGFKVSQEHRPLSANASCVPRCLQAFCGALLASVQDHSHDHAEGQALNWLLNKCTIFCTRVTIEYHDQACTKVVVLHPVQSSCLSQLHELKLNVKL